MRARDARKNEESVRMSIEAEKTEAKGGARDTIRVIIHALIRNSKQDT